MSDNLGGDAVQLAYAVWDSAQAALVGLNPVPVLVTSVLVGLIQPRRGLFLVKAVLALLPALLIAAIWPAFAGYAPIWPDLTQMEAQVQLGVQLVMAWVIIRLLWAMRATLSLTGQQPQPRANGH